MANRRMFAKQIVESDTFLEMSLQAQILYFHLGLNSDDRGYVNNTRAIMGMVGATNEHREELVKNKFLLKRSVNGLYLIKHFPMNNYIQKDRFKETAYLDDLQTLYYDEHGCYTERITEKPCLSAITQEKDKNSSVGSVDRETALRQAENAQKTIEIIHLLYDTKFLKERVDNRKQYKELINGYVDKIEYKKMLEIVNEVITRFIDNETGEIKVNVSNKLEILKEELDKAI